LQPHEGPEKGTEKEEKRASFSSTGHEFSFNTTFKILNEIEKEERSKIRYRPILNSLMKQ